MARALRATPSNAGDMHPFQKFLSDAIDELVDKHQLARTSVLMDVRAYETTFAGMEQMGALTESHEAVLQAMGMPHAEAKHFTETLFEGQQQDIEGIRHMCPSMFSFGDLSLWRGFPSNGNVRKLAKSIVCSGFRQDSVIASRTLDLLAPEGGNNRVSFHLLLGDGSARAVAACLVWLLLTQNLAHIPRVEPIVDKMIRSLLMMQVSFERHGSGTPREALVAQASRQNQMAAVQPVHTLQWIGMVRVHTGINIGEHSANASNLLKSMETMVGDYNNHPEIDAYDKAEIMPVKRRRKNQVAVDEDRDVGLKVGRRRLNAMKTFLAGATEEVWDMLNVHLFVVGGYMSSVVSDQVLQLKWLYVGSRLPKEFLPCPTDIAARDAVSESTLKLIPVGAATAEIRFDSPLTTVECELLFSKFIRMFESDIEGMDSSEMKSKHRPSVDSFMNTRRIVQFWHLSIAPCAEKDLSAADFETFRKVVFNSTQVDKDLLNILERCPKWFHMGLMPHIATEEGKTEDSMAKLTQVQQNAEKALFEVLEVELANDWQKIRMVAKGNDHLRELTAWLDNRHRRGQAHIGEALVRDFCQNHFPFCELASWDKVPSQINLLEKTLRKGTGKSRAVLLMDFNSPNARDGLRLQSLCAAAGACCQNFGPSESVLLAWMPNCCKEGSTTSPFDDEVTISGALHKAGFKCQLRIRMMLEMPASVSSKVSSLDWFIDGRLCFFDSEQFPSKENFWYQNSELARTRIVKSVGCMPEPDEMVEAVSLEADEDLNTTSRYLDISEKCAQRGVSCCLVQLQALMEKTARQHPQSAWCSRGDSTFVIDFHPHVGDRALATYEYHKMFDGANGRMLHVVLAVNGGSHKKHSVFAAERLSQKVATDWMEEHFVLCDKGGNAVRPVRDAPGPTPDELQRYPGCTEAHLGLTKLQWQVCTLVGSKIKLRPDKLSPFSCASPETTSKVAKMQVKHAAEYENALSSLSGALEVKTDPKPESPEPEDPVGDLDPHQAELVKFESLEALKAKEKNMVECKCITKGVTMYRAENHKAIYFVATKEDVVIKAGEMLGGIGGGIIADSDVNKTKAVPWSLPLDDRTHVQLSREKGKKDDGDEDKSKFWSGTMYACLRDLDAASTKPIKITSFGMATAVSDNGKQFYRFGTPEGAENHHALDFSMTVSKKDSKTTAQNFFSPAIDRATGFGQGCLRPTWRLCFDSVAQTLKPTKVHVTASARIVLTKGQPVKVSWHSE
jgi:hypothetical protein